MKPAHNFQNDTSALNDMPASSDTSAAATTALSTESNFAMVNQKIRSSW